MYIPEFWFGVFSTVLAEVVAFIVFCIWISLKGAKK